MNRKTLEQLDYYRIRERIASFCVSIEGKEALLKREPITDKEEGDNLRLLALQWHRLLHSLHPKALHGWEEIESLFSIVKVEGAALTTKQAFALLEFCLSASDVQNGVEAGSKEVDISDLLNLSTTLPDLTVPEKEIDRIVDKSGEMKDLPEIRAIRSRIASLRKEIDNEIRSYTTDPKYSSSLQSSVPVLRGGHQVLAVRSDRRGGIQGIVHEMSQTGQTMYIEPESVVRKNNELIQEEYHLQQEVHKIMTELTSKLRETLYLFRRALPIMKKLDMTQAAARWCDECKGIFADTVREGEAPLLLQARHPLLQEKAVPIDVRFMSGKNVLIITGPNTGGKTVTLKTIALFSLLNQSGFPIPAAEGTKLPVFNSVYADIGDDQSIDESLSTFSAHMKNIANAVRNANEKSLVLLDELGSGTDPSEGSAIAMAVLDNLIEKKSFVLVTTHHGILKNYGYTHPACINASVDFDENTLSPTYRLLMGVPGESHALDIAKRSGLPKFIVQNARNYMVNEQADVSKLIKGLTEKHAELEELERESRKKEASLNDRQQRLDLKALKQQQRELELKQREHGEESLFLKDTRKRLENLVRSLREGEINREKTLGVKSFIAELTNYIEEEDKEIKAEAEKIEEERARITENGMRLTKKSQSYESKKNKNGGKKKLSNAELLEQLKADEASTVSLEMPQAQILVKRVEEERPEWIEGAIVFMGKDKMRGVLIHEEKKGVWSVQFGAVRMSVKQKNLALASMEVQKRSSQATSVVVETAGMSSGDEKPVFELRLLGMRYEEAIKALERQLDLCAINNFKNFSIIHGKGNGILQQGVQQYLSSYPGVAEFSFARPEDGGTGKTYVKLV